MQGPRPTNQVGVSAGRVWAGLGRPEPGQVRAGSHGTSSEPGHGRRDYGQVQNPDLNLTKPDQTRSRTFRTASPAGVAQTTAVCGSRCLYSCSTVQPSWSGDQRMPPTTSYRPSSSQTSEPRAPPVFFNATLLITHSRAGSGRFGQPRVTEELRASSGKVPCEPART